jgi:hypothetical protein
MANLKYRNNRALNSAVECHLHTVEVVGSNPTAPTIAPNFADESGGGTREARIGKRNFSDR